MGRLNGVTLALLTAMAMAENEQFMRGGRRVVVVPESENERERKRRIEAETIAKAKAKRARKAEKYRATHPEDAKNKNN